MKKIRVSVLVIVLMTLLSLPSRAQRWSVSTNAFDYVNFLAINAEASYSVKQHITVNAGVRWSPWEFKGGWSTDKGSGELDVYNKQITAYAGMRYWPWYTYSGWWIGGKLQYCDYASTGLWRPDLETGQGAGIGFSFGYTWMITKHFNIEAGIGAWGGYLFNYELWDCPKRKYCYDQGPRAFFYPDDLFVTFMYVF